MNSIMKNSVLIAHRRGDSVFKIAETLGFPVKSIEKVITPCSVGKITTAVVSVKQRPIPVDRSGTMEIVHMKVVEKEITQMDRIENLLSEILKCLRNEKAEKEQWSDRIL